MQPEEFRLAQSLAGWTNYETSKRLKVKEVTVEKWRAGARGIAPSIAETFLELVQDIIQERVIKFNAINRKYR